METTNLTLYFRRRLGLSNLGGGGSLMTGWSSSTENLGPPRSSNQGRWQRCGGCGKKWRGEQVTGNIAKSGRAAVPYMQEGGRLPGGDVSPAPCSGSEQRLLGLQGLHRGIPAVAEGLQRDRPANPFQSDGVLSHCRPAYRFITILACWVHRLRSLMSPAPSSSRG